MKRKKPAPLTEAYLRKVAEYYENQPLDEALADIARLKAKGRRVRRSASGVASKQPAQTSAKAKSASKTVRKVSETKATYGVRKAAPKTAAKKPVSKKK